MSKTIMERKSDIGHRHTLQASKPMQDRRQKRNHNRSQQKINLRKEW